MTVHSISLFTVISVTLWQYRGSFIPNTDTLKHSVSTVTTDWCPMDLNVVQTQLQPFNDATCDKFCEWYVEF